MNSKDAFKAGFVAVLAEHRVSPGDLVVACEKLAAMDLPAKIMTLGTVGSVAAPLGLGHSLGTSAEQLLSSELDDDETARKRYLVLKLQRVLDAERVKRSNKLVSEALKA